MLWVILLAVRQALQSQLSKLKDNNSDGATIKQCLQEKTINELEKPQNFHCFSRILTLQASVFKFCNVPWYDMIWSLNNGLRLTLACCYVYIINLQREI